MYCINYRFWTKKYIYILFKISASHLFLNRFYFWLGPGSASGKKEKKRSAWAWQKKNKTKQKQRGSLGRGNVSLEKTVCMQRSTHAEVPRGRNAWRTSRASSGPGGKGWWPPITLPRPTLGSLRSRIFFLFDQVFPPLRSLVPGFLIFRAYKQ